MRAREQVNERANEWAQRSARAKQQCRTSEWVSGLRARAGGRANGPELYALISKSSNPLCDGVSGGGGNSGGIITVNQKKVVFMVQVIVTRSIIKFWDFLSKILLMLCFGFNLSTSRSLYLHSFGNSVVSKLTCQYWKGGKSEIKSCFQKCITRFNLIYLLNQ